MERDGQVEPGLSPRSCPWVCVVGGGCFPWCPPQTFEASGGLRGWPVNHPRGGSPACSFVLVENNK